MTTSQQNSETNQAPAIPELTNRMREVVLGTQVLMLDAMKSDSVVAEARME